MLAGRVMRDATRQLWVEISAIVDWTVLLHSLIKQHETGKLEATTLDATFANGGLTSQPFEGAPAKRVPRIFKKATLKSSRRWRPARSIYLKAKHIPVVPSVTMMGIRSADVRGILRK